MSLKIVSIQANSADPDEMLPYAAFHLGLHCLQSTCLLVSRMKRKLFLQTRAQLVVGLTPRIEICFF